VLAHLEAGLLPGLEVVAGGDITAGALLGTLFGVERTRLAQCPRELGLNGGARNKTKLTMDQYCWKVEVPSMLGWLVRVLT